MMQLSREQFAEKVFEKLQEYASRKTEDELKAAIKEYDSIIQDGFTHYRGRKYGIDYAAWNIFLCL